MKKKYISLTIFIVIAIIFSALLTFSNIPEICGIDNGCNKVQISEYSSILGIKNSLIGMIAFAAIGIIIYSHIKHPKQYKKRLIQLGIIGGSMIALYFLYLQFFVLEAICKYCMVVDIATLISLGILFFWEEK